MNDQQLAAERAAFVITEEIKNAHNVYMETPCDFDMIGQPITRRSAGWPDDILTFAAGYRAALAQREPVAEEDMPLMNYPPRYEFEVELGGGMTPVVFVEFARWQQTEVARLKLEWLSKFQQETISGCKVLLERTEAARLEAEEEIEEAWLISVANNKELARMNEQLATERARSEKLVGALGDMLSWAYRNFEWGCTPMEIVKATAAQRAYQSSKENDK